MGKLLYSADASMDIPAPPASQPVSCCNAVVVVTVPSRSGVLVPNPSCKSPMPFRRHVPSHPGGAYAGMGLEQLASGLGASIW